jgi:hypothetical protein
MWYTVLITLVVDVGGLLLVYVVLRDRLQRAMTVQSQIAEIREEVSRLLVELNQTTDRNVALMEDKISSLNEALSTADKKIGLLHREIEKHDVGSQIYSRLAEGRARPPAALPGRPEAGEQPRQGRLQQEPPGEPVPRPANEGRTAAVPKAMPSLAVELSEKPEAPGERRDASPAEERKTGAEPDLRERVMMLHRAGFSLSLIASRVGAPLGEVELIVSLEQRKGQM